MTSRAEALCYKECRHFHTYKIRRDARCARISPKRGLGRNNSVYFIVRCANRDEELVQGRKWFKVEARSQEARRQGQAGVSLEWGRGVASVQSAAGANHSWS
jgi:hypothetical protein